jgi:transglycosylase-like protein with SLT domain
MLSALAGGGLTAVGLSGPLAGAALGAEAPSVASVPSEGASTTPNPSAGAPQPGTGQPSSTTTAPASPAAPSSAPSGTGSLPAQPPQPQAQGPTVVLQRKQETTKAAKPAGSASPTSQSPTGKPKGAVKPPTATGPSNVALSPQAIAAQAGALAALLASSQASVQALGFYRIPLFLLPIYKAAAVQYGVPWQILAAINEIETDYGSDQSVSSAGAVGWMQFMPATWLQYGVDALDAGYADPYNPVDAIFAAARYLRAAGAANDLRAAILAYNHSQEYVDSVLLRAKLISTYPKAVIATLTGLIDGRSPVTGSRLTWAAAPASPSSATANATSVPSHAASGSAAAGAPSASTPPAPAAAVRAKPAAAPLQLVALSSAPNASVVAVQDGRIVRLGHSRQLGRYVTLRDVYGDLFTYAGLGSIAPSYTPAKPRHTPIKSPLVEVASTPDPAPSQPASAGSQPPLTLQVKSPLIPPTGAPASSPAQASGQGGEESPAAGTGKVRLFAHPGNPDARAAAAGSPARSTHSAAGQRLRLSKGSVVATGTVLGRVSMPPHALDGHLRFAIQPAGDPSSVDPRPILSNWAQLGVALHPQGATAGNALLGATASDVFLLSKAQLERTVLSDPDIAIVACGRHDVASGKVDKRVLAVLAFLSRSGLKPTVSALLCRQSQNTSAGAASAHGGDALDISAINGVAIGGHQGAGTITDLTIRTLLTLPSDFVPQQIVSLMRYPGAPSTHAVPSYWNRIHLAFAPSGLAVAPVPSAAASAAHSARAGHAAPSPLLSDETVSPVQWDQLFTRIAALPAPTVARKPSSSAIPDRKRP